MRHLDLFSGIGGFSLAADRVFGEVDHTFVEIDPFCQEVLKKHWPESRIYGDIRTVTDTTNSGFEKVRERKNEIFLLTGGFPCQPFSQAGQRRGTEDNRYLWPEMLRVIREFKPTWVIAENVRGLLTWSEGLVFEQVCSDLEAEGYEVQSFIIPACSVNAPHRRDRVWFIAHSKNEYEERPLKKRADARKSQASIGNRDWDEEWIEVATRLCRVDDGLPRRVDRLKSLGNAIVPQVAMKIMEGIRLFEQ